MLVGELRNLGVLLEKFELEGFNGEKGEGEVDLDLCEILDTFKFKAGFF